MLLEEAVINALKKDFLTLVEKIEKKDREDLYGCALVIDKKFVEAHLMVNTVNTLNRKEKENSETAIRYDWNVNNWKHSTKRLEKRELDDVCYKLAAIDMDKKEGVRHITEPMFTRALKRLKTDLEKEGMNTDRMCFFVTATGQSDNKEIESAKIINEGFILKKFLENK